MTDTPDRPLWYFMHQQRRRIERLKWTKYMPAVDPTLKLVDLDSMVEPNIGHEEALRPEEWTLETRQ